jgi:hypothetical protein
MATVSDRFKVISLMLNNSIRLLSINDIKKWPHSPAFHYEISHLQSMLIIALLRFTKEMEIDALLSCIHVKLPTELLLIIIRKIESDALKSRQKIIKQKVYKPFKGIPPMVI